MLDLIVRHASLPDGLLPLRDRTRYLRLIIFENQAVI